MSDAVRVVVAVVLMFAGVAALGYAGYETTEGDRRARRPRLGWHNSGRFCRWRRRA
jgi:hypothetical protein